MYLFTIKTNWFLAAPLSTNHLSCCKICHLEWLISADIILCNTIQYRLNGSLVWYNELHLFLYLLCVIFFIQYALNAQFINFAHLNIHHRDLISGDRPATSGLIEKLTRRTGGRHLDHVLWLQEGFMDGPAPSVVIEKLTRRTRRRHLDYVLRLDDTRDRRPHHWDNVLQLYGSIDGPAPSAVIEKLTRRTGGRHLDYVQRLDKTLGFFDASSERGIGPASDQARNVVQRCLLLGLLLVDLATTTIVVCSLVGRTVWRHIDNLFLQMWTEIIDWSSPLRAILNIEYDKIRWLFEIFCKSRKYVITL